jgi:hypothetical protein
VAGFEAHEGINVVDRELRDGETGSNRITSGLPTNRKVARPVNTSAFIGTNLEAYILDRSVQNAIQPGGINS